MSRMDRVYKYYFRKNMILTSQFKFDKMLFSKTSSEEKCSKDVLNYENYFCEKECHRINFPLHHTHFLLMMIIISSISYWDHTISLFWLSCWMYCLCVCILYLLLSTCFLLKNLFYVLCFMLNYHVACPCCFCF